MNKIQKKFKSSIRRGTGEAYLILLQNPEADISKYIIDAAVYNYAYDKQSEGSRSVYIVSLILLSTQNEYIVNTLIKKLTKKKTDVYGIRQLFDIVGYFANEGNEAARAAMYKRFNRNLKAGYEYGGNDAIIQLDGIEGLKRVAEITEKILLADPEDWEDSSRINEFQEKNPDIDIMFELTEAASKNKYIKKYIDVVKASDEERKNRPIKPTGLVESDVSYEALDMRIKESSFRSIRPAEIARIDIEDLKKIATDFLNTSDVSLQMSYLKIFIKVKFPYGYKPLLKKLNFTKGQNDRLTLMFIYALQLFKAKELRKLAIKKIEQLDQAPLYSTLLVANYKHGDHKLLVKLANSYEDLDIVEQLAINYIDIFDANPTAKCKKPLEILYNKMNCGIHRTSLIEILQDNNVCSKKIINEMRYDCSSSTRAIAAELKNNNTVL